jgi:hypothetical protein
VTADETEHGTRYSLMETLRAYARERAIEAGELQALGQRHLEWYLAMAETTAHHLVDAQYIDRLARDHDNFRAALRFSVDGGYAEAGLRLGCAVHALWFAHGLYAEGRAWMNELLPSLGSAAPARVRLRALAAAGHLAGVADHLAESEQLLREGIATAQQLGDEVREARCLQSLADTLHRRGLPGRPKRWLNVPYCWRANGAFAAWRTGQRSR